MSSMAAAGQLIAHTESSVPGRYMVVLDHPPGYAFESAGKEVSDFITRHKITVTDVWNDALNGFLITDVDEATAKSLSALPGVRFVEADSKGTPSNTQYNPPIGLDRIDQRSTTLDSIYKYNYTGSNVHAYILDSGIQTSHSDFGGRASNDIDCFNYNSCTHNPNERPGHHGTAVASIVGGSTYGAAKGVLLHSVKVNELEEASASNLVKALNWVKQNAIKPAVVNISIQFPRSAAIDSAAYGVFSQGIFISAAAGNASVPTEYLDTCTISPAAAQGVLAVSADSGPDGSTPFGLGPCVSVFGPSTTAAADVGSTTASTTLIGTSTAAPFATGIAALILQQYPNLTPDQVRWELVARATQGIVATQNLHGAPNIFLYSLPIYSTTPSAPASLTVGATNCATETSHLNWVNGSNTTYSEVQNSATSSFPSTGSSYLEPKQSIDALVLYSTTYFRVRNCNSLGCSAFINGNTPAFRCP